MQDKKGKKKQLQQWGVVRSAPTARGPPRGHQKLHSHRTHHTNPTFPTGEKGTHCERSMSDRWEEGKMASAEAAWKHMRYSGKERHAFLVGSLLSRARNGKGKGKRKRGKASLKKKTYGFATRHRLWRFVTRCCNHTRA